MYELNKINSQKIFLIFFPYIFLLGPFFTEVFLLYIVGLNFFNLKTIKSKIINDNKFIQLFFIIIFVLSFVNYPEVNIKNFLYIRFYIYYIFVSILFDDKTNINNNLNQFIKSIIFILIFLVLFHFIQLTTNIDVIDGRLTIPIRQEEIAVSIYTKLYTFILIFFLLSNHKIRNSNFFKKYRLYMIFVILFVPIIVFFSGERMNSIMFFGLLIIIFYKYNSVKFLILFFSILTFIIVMLNFEIFNNFLRIQYIFDRYNIFFELLNNNFLFESAWGNHFFVAFDIFKENYLTGVGIKMFRVECVNYVSELKYACSTHPHNLYLEIASETGILSIVLFILILIKVLIIFFKYILKKKYSYIEIFILCLSLCILIYAFPIRSTGSFYNNYNSSFFWVYLSILFTLFNNEKKKI